MCTNGLVAVETEKKINNCWMKPEQFSAGERMNEDDMNEM